MSIFARSVTPAIDEKRDWLTNDDYWAGTMTSAGINVSRESAMSVSTVWRCITLLTDAVSMCPVDVTVKVGGLAWPEYVPPEWLTTPYPPDPTITTRDHFAQVVTSLLTAGNSFTAVLPSVYEPRMLLILDPASVEVKRNASGAPFYEVRDNSGRVVETFDVNQMLHIPFIRLPGQMRGINALEAMRRSIGLAAGTEEFGSRFFGQGATLSFGVEVPGVLTEDQRKQLTESLKARYAGTRNSHAIGVLTAGAKFVPNLQPTPEQAQFLATRKFSVEDIARFFGVPPHLVGSQEPGASSYNSVEQRSKEFAQWSVQPLTVRIESTYTRLLQVPDRISSPTAKIEMKFNTDSIQRADLQSRFSAYSSGIMAGVLKPNEARALEDLPPTPGGDVTYMQMQMVPITQNPMLAAGAVTPPGTGAVAAPNRAAEPEEVESREIVPAQPIALNIAEATFRDDRVIPPTEVRIEPPVINYSPPEVVIDMTPVAEALAAALGSFTEVIRNQPAPVVNVPAPVVNVAAPIVNVPHPKAVIKHVERDPHSGNIIRVREEQAS